MQTVCRGEVGGKQPIRMDLLAPNQSLWLFVAQATNKADIVAPALNCLFRMRVRKGSRVGTQAA
jgi:hypothetical protein